MKWFSSAFLHVLSPHLAYFTKDGKALSSPESPSPRWARHRPLSGEEIRWRFALGRGSHLEKGTWRYEGAGWW